jgi:hypothetical protein
MTCQEAKQLIRCHRLFADGLGDGDSTALAEHLLSCAACSEAMDREEAFDAAVRPAILEVSIPANLAQNIYWALRRIRRARQRRLTLYASLAAAAALCLALSTGWYYQRPYDLTRLQEQSANVLAKFEPPSEGRDRALTEWLQRQGIAATMPSRLKLQYLTGAYVTEVNGRKVVVLELNKPGSAIRVYLLQRKYFDERQRQELEQEGIVSKVIADGNESPSLGWIVIDQGSDQAFHEPHRPVSPD